MKQSIDVMLLTKTGMEYGIFKEELLADQVEEADTFFSRLFGLMGRNSLKPGEGLLLRNCKRIHTCFMKFPIDVVYLTGDGTVIYIQTLAPWQRGKKLDATVHTLELPAGAADRILIGSRLVLQEKE